MAKYNEMNDPMEGAFFYSSGTAPNILDEIWTGKRSQMICCFSKTYKNTLLWSHYADSHKGCCLEVDVTSRLDSYDVVYSPNMPQAISGTSDLIPILTHKSPYWGYEQEVRYFKNVRTLAGHNARPYISIRIKKVYLGYKLDDKDYSFFKSLIHSIDEKIEVEKMKKDDLDTGLI